MNNSPLLALILLLLLVPLTVTSQRVPSEIKKCEPQKEGEGGPWTNLTLSKDNNCTSHHYNYSICDFTEEVRGLKMCAVGYKPDHQVPCMISKTHHKTNKVHTIIILLDQKCYKGDRRPTEACLLSYSYDFEDSNKSDESKRPTSEPPEDETLKDSNIIQPPKDETPNDSNIIEPPKYKTLKDSNIKEHPTDIFLTHYDIIEPPKAVTPNASNTINNTSQAPLGSTEALSLFETLGDIQNKPRILAGIFGTCILVIVVQTLIIIYLSKRCRRQSILTRLRNPSEELNDSNADSHQLLTRSHPRLTPPGSEDEL